MTFRWYGESESITLDHIRQIPCMTGVVTAVYSVPAGEVWPQEEIDKMKAMVNEKGLEMEVIESVPVHEDIKLRQGTVAQWIMIINILLLIIGFVVLGKVNGIRSLENILVKSRFLKALRVQMHI